ncbi:MAG: DUF2813 domain-containing protein, partial [Candidatus Korarchaeota archaeon NZ13-K]
MLVESLELHELRGIRRLSKPLELTEFNVLIGRNNVGKTAILEALYLLRMPFATYPLPPYGEDLPTLLSKLHGGPSSLIYGYAGEARII